jgi:hypothetical protein
MPDRFRSRVKVTGNSNLSPKFASSISLFNRAAGARFWFL